MNSEWTIKTELPVSFSVKNSPNLFSFENLDVLQSGTVGPGSRRLVVVDEKVYQLYGSMIEMYFQHHQIDFRIVCVDGIEVNKSFESLIFILNEMMEFDVMRRDEPVIAIGGGVVQDLVGLAATMYRRGVPYIRVPTTLLGIVDVSIAAKTGINFGSKRNRLGSYYPPIITLLDKSFVKTVEPIEISSGMGEILKMAVVKDYSLFELLETYGRELLDSKFDHSFGDEVIAKSIQGMKEELENNLWEKNLCRLVDFGHSFSPTLEMLSLETEIVPSLTHGQAVTLDVLLSCCISFNRGMLSYDDLKRVFVTAKSLTLPTSHEFFQKPTMLSSSLNDTIKHRNGAQNLPTPELIGQSVFINDLSFDEIAAGVETMNRVNEELFE